MMVMRILVIGRMVVMMVCVSRLRSVYHGHEEGHEDIDWEDVFHDGLIRLSGVASVPGFIVERRKFIEKY